MDTLSPADPYPLLAISCSSASTCVATGGSGANGSLYYESSVGSFVAETEPDAHGSTTPDGVIPAVSCASSGFCSAVAYDANDDHLDDILTSTGGASWALTVYEEAYAFPSYINMTSMQCLDSSDCVATGSGYNGATLVTTSNAWLGVGQADLTSSIGDQEPELDSLSCVPGLYCLTSGQESGFTITGSTSMPSTNNAANPSSSTETYAPIDGSLCLSSTVCAEVGNDDGEEFFSGLIAVTTDGANLSGSNWVTESVPSGTGNLTGIACTPAVSSSRGVCLAVGETAPVAGSAETGDILLDLGDPLSEYAPIGGQLLNSEMFGGWNELELYACECQAQTGNPVNIEDGDFYESSTDASVPTIGPSLQFTRTYDAQMAQAEVADGDPGPFGYGWTDNWATNLQISDGGDDITVVGPSGAETSFVAEGSGCPSPDVLPVLGGTYCALPRVMGALTTEGTGYQLELSTGSVESFNSLGQLTSITNTESQELTVAYGAESPGSEECPSNSEVTPTESCETITSASGLVLTIGWSDTGETGEITSVTGPTGNRTTYSYCSSSFVYYGETCLTGDLIEVTNPQSDETEYTYDASNGTAGLRHDLTSVEAPTTSSLLDTTQISDFCSSPTQATATFGFEINCYNGDGRVVAQSDYSGETMTLDYSAMNESTGTGEVVVTNGDGDPSDDTFAASELVQKVVSPAGDDPLETSHLYDPATLAPTLNFAGGNVSVNTVDAGGNVLSSSDGAGDTTAAAYNSDDQVWCSVNAAYHSNGASCPSITPPTSIPST
ncbi:MAG TPA: DUF6531 domain-containing protein, partial [Acidimicrobiales bacterium]|nr:DUF6531 domain-containing protein [Acidimicrobiales bacterium]